MSTDPDAGHESFVTLLRVAEEDPAVRRTLRALLRQPAFHRRSLLGTLVRDMRAQGAPEDFVDAVAALADDAVAWRVAQMMSD